MTRDWRLPICAGLSIAAHVGLAHGLARLPRRAEPRPTRIVSLRVVSPPPAEPPPEPVHEPEIEAPRPTAQPRAHVRTAPPQTHAPPPTDTPPPPEHAATAGVGPVAPVYGVTMDSTSQAGTGPAMPVGRTGGGVAPTEQHHEDAQGGGLAPVPAYEVTTMPLPQGRCVGAYTEEAKSAGIEGTVILDLIVSETGRVRDVQVVSGLAHGLTDAAITAAKKCRFSPGEKNGTPVPVRVRGFKIRFLLQNDE